MPDLANRIDHLPQDHASGRPKFGVAAQTIYQALIDAELTSVIGAGPFGTHRDPDRAAHRDTAAAVVDSGGDLELAIPKLRQGSFFPSLLERRRRVDQALFAVIMEAYLHGVSTRKVDDGQSVGHRHGISKSEVSRICADMDVEVATFRDRSLAETHGSDRLLAFIDQWR